MLDAPLIQTAEFICFCQFYTFAKLVLEMKYQDVYRVSRVSYMRDHAIQYKMMEV